MSHFLLKAILALPGAKVNRMEYLSSNFRRYGMVERLNNETPVSVYGQDIVERVAKSSINAHTFRTTIESTACGVPGGIAMVGTLPTDMIQFNYHIVVLAQKLAYLYGWDSLFDENGNIDDETYVKLSLFIGRMYGVQVAEDALKSISRCAAENLVKKLPKMALTKSLLYRTVREVAKHLGVKVTKDSFAKAVGKAIPFVGGAISGVMTYASFRPMANRLNESFKDSYGMVA